MSTAERICMSVVSDCQLDPTSKIGCNCNIQCPWLCVEALLTSSCAPMSATGVS